MKNSVNAKIGASGKKIVFVFVLCITIVFSSYRNTNFPYVPEVGTAAITKIPMTSPLSGGAIIDDGVSKIREKGVCWRSELEPDHTTEGFGQDEFTSKLTNLQTGTRYYVRAYARNDSGTGYGTKKIFRTNTVNRQKQIIADHTIVDGNDKIPLRYIDEAKKMWVLIPDESYNLTHRAGLSLLGNQNDKYAIYINDSGTSEGYRAIALRVSPVKLGNMTHSSGWVYEYGEDDWWTNVTTISQTKAGISYCNTSSPALSAIGFGWFWDMLQSNPCPKANPVYGCRWYGSTEYVFQVDLSWGLDGGDDLLTGNTLTMDSYLWASQSYLGFCILNGYQTKVLFTTSPVYEYYTGECGYQGFLKHEHICEYDCMDSERILFDYEDILCNDNYGSKTTLIWNGHTYPSITKKNLGDGSIVHINTTGAIRLAKAMWWMLARMAGLGNNRYFSKI